MLPTANGLERRLLIDSGKKNKKFCVAKEDRPVEATGTTPDMASWDAEE